MAECLICGDSETADVQLCEKCFSTKAREKDPEIEKLRMQLVACSEAARANTRDIPCGVALEYQSASFQDVRDAVKREMGHRERADKAEAALRPFAAMHREGCKPSDLALMRGHGYDMTVLESRHFQAAHDILNG